MSKFEQIRRVNDQNEEYWSARELAKALEYDEYRNFTSVILNAMEACRNSGYDVESNFRAAETSVTIGRGATRLLNDYHLSRYACYLVVQNADPSKDVVAQGQTYFAVQTRRQELADAFEQLSEDNRRVQLRGEMKEHNSKLADAAKDAGVETKIEYATFQNYGYQGLYGGLGAKEIHRKKKLKPSQKILDHMGSTELAANLFRATQTEEKLRREGITGKTKAYRTHYEVGGKIRQTIAELGGTMPEDLPTPEKGIKQLEREQKKQLSQQAKDEENQDSER